MRPKMGTWSYDFIPKWETTKISISLIMHGLLWRKQKTLGKCYRVSEYAAPKHHFGIRTILSWSNWKMADGEGALCSSLLWLSAGHRVPLRKMSPFLSQTSKKMTLITRDTESTEISQPTKQTVQNKPYLPLVSAIYLPSYNLPPQSPNPLFLVQSLLHNSLPFAKMVSKFLSLTTSLGFLFSVEPLYVENFKY